MASLAFEVMEQRAWRHLPPGHTRERDVAIACMVLNGAKLRETGAKYGIGAERARQITARLIYRSSRAFVRKHGIGLDVWRPNRRYLIRRIKTFAKRMERP
jgi:hypothetical protein